MSILNSVIKLFVGDKQQKDLKGLQPVIENVNKFELAFSKLSHDELREKTRAFKNKLKNATKEVDDQIATLEEEAKTAQIDRQEDIYTEIDTLKDEAYTISEGILIEIMPEAFAVVKENYAFDKDKKVLFISAKVAKALNLKPGSLAQVN
jgi:preprotein translocase subunit SecA